ncbi:nuclear transport factor 2 family protein [Paenibacillus daejeonensis]|uniref:nuclear transport factor 2 family protein n=1 Tax=Paenibacillus daejeonensis TaxID=135193 RepID=UPI00037807E7|nr:nuclear transport factor 2 family protein [Paenibacillus daejeonensis]
MTKTPTLIDIAAAFSKGHFEVAYPFFADHIEWNIIGENRFAGKEAVMANCKRTASYFDSVTTDFQMSNIIADHNRVAINGTATFTRGDEKLAFVSACDVYEFNDNHELQRIDSYCITHKDTDSND